MFLLLKKKLYGESNVKECTNLYFIHVRVCHYERFVGFKTFKPWLQCKGPENILGWG